MIPLTMPSPEIEEFSDHFATKAVKAGRRTYFFDARVTRRDDCFLTITESRKINNSDGSCSYERHKIFLYKEDFDKFIDGLNEVLGFIRSRQSKAIENKCEKLIE